MTSKAGLKAGLIGAAVILVLTLISLVPIPFLNCICCGLTWLVYIVIGALAGYFLVPPRTAGAGAGAGALAGVISSSIGGIVNSIIVAVGAGSYDPDVMLTPEIISQLRELGVDPATVTDVAGAGGVVVTSVLCCLGVLFIGAMLGALGGALFGALQTE